MIVDSMGIGIHRLPMSEEMDPPTKEWFWRWVYYTGSDLPIGIAVCYPTYMLLGLWRRVPAASMYVEVS